MLNAIREWWRTPMVPRSELIDLRYKFIDILTEKDRVESDNAQLKADVEEAIAELDATRLERDKAVGKFEYIEAKNAELAKQLDDRERYVEFLQSQVRDKQDANLDSRFDDHDDIDDLCDECGLEIEDCDCDIDGEHDCEVCGKDLYDCDCGDEGGKCEDDEDDGICPYCGQEM